jgi:hypothetical protein
MATKNIKPALTDDEKANIAKLKSSLYGKALTALSKAHKQEFDATLADLYRAEGLTYTARLTPEERKRKQLDELAAELGVIIANPEDLA